MERFAKLLNHILHLRFFLKSRMLKMLKRDPFSKQKIIFKKIWFFSLLLLSGTVLTIKLKRPEALLALKAASWISSDYPLIMFLIVKIMSWRWSYRGIQLIIRLRVGLSHLREHKFKPSFQDYEFQFPDAVLMWNQLLISFSTAPCTTMKEILTWALKKRWLQIARFDWNRPDKKASTWKLFCIYIHTNKQILHVYCFPSLCRSFWK